MQVGKCLKSALIVTVLLMTSGCAINSPEWANMSGQEKILAAIQDARQTAEAIRWIAEPAMGVVEVTCPECAAGAKMASASYQALSINLDRAAYILQQDPDDPEAQEKLAELNEQAKEAWEELDAAYKGHPEELAETGEEMQEGESA